MLRPTWRRLRLPVQVLRHGDNRTHYDLCVIGGGPAGIAAALRGVDFGRSVCLVESDRVGGTDVWNGTIPSKTMWELARFTSRLANPSFAERLFDPALSMALVKAVDEDRLRTTLRTVSETKENHILTALQAAGVHLVRGKAMFASETEVDVHTVGSAEYRVLSADYFVLATGSKPRKYPLYPTDHRRIITSEDIFHLPIPKSMVIIGAGRMGCEFAAMYAHLGRTKIYLIDRASQILPSEDGDVADYVQRHLLQRGVTIHHDGQLLDLEVQEDDAGEGHCQYSVQNRHTGLIQSFAVERALVTIGRTPRTRDLGLENTRMRVRDGYIEVDAYNRCLPYSHIYCVGEGSSAQEAAVTVAQMSARAAVNDMFGRVGRRTVAVEQMRNVARVAFLEEELAGMGLNETQCQQRQIAYVMAKFDYAYLTRAMVMGETEGFVKLLVSNDREKRVLGVRVIGPHSSSVVEIVSLAIRTNETVYGLLRLVTGYPSVVLGLVECIQMVVGRGSMRANLLPGITVKEWSPPNYEQGRAYATEANTQAREAHAAEMTDIAHTEDARVLTAKVRVLEDAIRHLERQTSS